MKTKASDSSTSSFRCRAGEKTRQAVEPIVGRWIALAAIVVAWGLACTVAAAGTLNAVWNSADGVPLTTPSYTAGGNTVSCLLNFAPATGTDLMVVKNTGLGFISGTFDNLTNGQAVVLVYGGSNYRFVANYYGGSGNDLVLVWATTQVYGWGDNLNGQIGDNTKTTRRLPVPITPGALTGKTVFTLAPGGFHSLGLCSDGTVAAWGWNYFGQLGDDQASGPESLVPVAVNMAPGSALYGKTVVTIAAAGHHSLALCSDGTVAGWGWNQYGQLGDNTLTNRLVPVAVNTAPGSALHGKTVVAIAAGGLQNLALCSDGTVAAWGWNDDGQLGDNTETQRLIPVAVNRNGGVSALFGKTVVAIAAGDKHSLALCSDGTVTAWGGNNHGQLGDNSTNQWLVPVTVNTNSGVSALYGKRVVEIACGDYFSVAFCSDGTIATWGQNDGGELGDNTTTQRNAPVAVNTAPGVSALYGKTIAALTVGGFHSLALCSDRTVAAWGSNRSGQLGDGTTNVVSLVPEAVDTSALPSGQCFNHLFSGPSAGITLALVAAPFAPQINLAGNSLSITNGEGTPRTADGTDFGMSLLGSDPVAQTFTIQNTGPATLNLAGTPMVTVSGPQAGDFAVTTQPAFSSLASGGATSFRVSFTPSGSGTRRATLSIANDDPNRNPFVFAIQGTGISALAATYNSAADVAFTAGCFTATGDTVSFTLNFAPVPGTELMVVKNTGPCFINGTFANLTNAQPVTLSYGGVNYTFIANYYGGNGNDLVLVWADNRPFAWGWNGSGQLGDHTTTDRLQPVPVTTTPALAGKTVVAFAAGVAHSLALCSDGTVAAWGANESGQLGDGTQTAQALPVRVVAIAAGERHSLALCADGTVTAWGSNYRGQLGNGTNNSAVPVTVDTSLSSALHNRTAVAIAAGGLHSLALCAGGTVAAWGYNSDGQLGDNSVTSRYSPVAVNTTADISTLYRQTVVAIAAGYAHSVALCANGDVATWGANESGELGNGSTTSHARPVWACGGAVAIAAGYAHNLALCSDGTLLAWGYNVEGEVGDNQDSGDYSAAPVAVDTLVADGSALSGKTVVAIGAGAVHSLALCSDGTVAAWGYNAQGEVGDGTTTNRYLPMSVNTSLLAAGERVAYVSTGSTASHTLALVAAPPAASQIILTNTRRLPNGAFQFEFAGAHGAPFTVVTSTNVALPLSNWTSLTGLTEVSPGQFQFTDSPGANGPQRFYRVRTP